MFEIIAATTPINIATGTVTNPEAGVIATRPTTAPIQNPSALTFLPFVTSKSTHDKPAAAAATWVVEKAVTANEEAPTAEPALNPNHPNHNKPVPNKTYGMLAGGKMFDSICDFLLLQLHVMELMYL